MPVLNKKNNATKNAINRLNSKYMSNIDHQ